MTLKQLQAYFSYYSFILSESFELMNEICHSHMFCLFTINTIN